MTSLNRHDKVTPFMEFSVIGKKQPKNNSYRILVIISIGLLRSSYFNFLGSFQIVLFLTNFFQMPPLYRHEKVTRFMEFSANGKKKQVKKLSYRILVIISIALLRSSYFNFLRSFQILLFSTIFMQMTSLKQHENNTPFMEISLNGKEYFKIFSYKFSVLTSFALLQSSFFNFLHPIQIILFFTNFTQMPSLNWHEKVTRFTEFSANGKKTNLKIFHTSFSSIFQLQCYGQITAISYVHFRSFCS